MNPFDGMLEAIRSSLREVLAARQLERPAPYPIAVSIDDAAQLISVSPSTIKRLIAAGTIRTMRLDGAARTVIPVAALFELDPGHRRGELYVLGTTPPAGDVDEFGPEWDTTTGGAA